MLSLIMIMIFNVELPCSLDISNASIYISGASTLTSLAYTSDSQTVGRGPLVGREGIASGPPNHFQNGMIFVGSH